MEFEKFTCQKPVLVLLPGFCEAGFIWEPVMDALEHYFQVISLDLPGFGSEACIWKASVQAYACFVREELVQRDIHQCVMVGHSMGGYIALAYAKLFGDTLLGLGLFHSTSFSDSEKKQKEREKMISFLQKFGNHRLVHAQFAHRFSKQFQTTQKELIQKISKKAWEISGEEAMVTALQAMAEREESLTFLKSWSRPVMYLSGKEDRAVPWQRNQEEILQLTTAHMVILEQSGHFGMWEAPEKSVRAIVGFVKCCYRKEQQRQRVT
ncbi:alpha/beta hydrolase [Rapidithrix thailandica]|uniref:Alpha/beta hydrolase n=1 Tax=Rapidithrix thailandica TaxID=413964 RepID=A0AAW9S941_9BACT